MHSRTLYGQQTQLIRWFYWEQVWGKPSTRQLPFVHVSCTVKHFYLTKIQQGLQHLLNNSLVKVSQHPIKAISQQPWLYMTCGATLLLFFCLLHED